MDLPSRIGNLKVESAAPLPETMIQDQTALSLRSLCHPDKIELFFLAPFLHRE
jgi:hypothetical protein